jgi:hypothetical protein
VAPTATGATYEAELSFDFQAANLATLVNEVAPGASAQVPGLGDTAFLEQDLTDFTIDFPLPEGVTVSGTPTATGTGIGAGATVTAAAGKVSLVLPPIAVGSYNPGATVSPQRPPVAPFVVTLTVELDGDQPVEALVPTAGTFDLKYVTGVTLGESLSGGATAVQTCVLSATAPPPVAPGPTTVPPAPADPADPAAAPTSAPAPAGAVTPTGALPYTGVDVGTLRLVILALLLIDMGYLILTATTERTPMEFLRRR